MIRIICLSILFIVFQSKVGATGILDKIISVEIKSTPIKLILVAIEKKAHVVFSYNPQLIDENRVVSLSIKNQTIEFGLTLIFSKNVRFKEVGNHIILLENEPNEIVKQRRKSQQNTVFKGVIKNRKTGEPIEDASIYDVDSRMANVSDKYGNYELVVPYAEKIRSLYIRKKGFKEFVIVADVTQDSVVYRTILLEPIDSVEKMATQPIEPIFIPIEERALSGGLVSKDTYTHAENLPEINETRIAQISLVPSFSIGSNLSTNGLITNNYSLNILAGYSNGLSGVEIGGILNMDKGDVKWVQIGGVLNLVGGNTTGFQAGGIANSVRNDFIGFQVAGITNANGGNFLGLQVAGITNLVHANFRGLQIGGISSLTTGSILGAQISGIFSASRCGFNGMQISGITSLTDSASHGMQISGIHNMALGNFIGGQISGISNYSPSAINLLQIAGIANSTNENRGIQLAGIINYAKYNKGLQLGLINLSNESRGLAIGLFNFVKKGFHKTEIEYNETLPINLTFKSGNRLLYNNYSLGYRPDENSIYSAGMGLGSNFDLYKRWSLSVDLNAKMIFENDFEKFEFSSLYQFGTSIDFRMAKWCTAFIGPTFNVNQIHFKNESGDYSSAIGENGLFLNAYNSGRTKIWVGGKVGIRF